MGYKSNKYMIEGKRILMISTRAINFNPTRFDFELRKILKKYTLGKIEVIPEKSDIGFIIKISLSTKE